MNKNFKTVSIFICIALFTLLCVNSFAAPFTDLSSYNDYIDSFHGYDGIETTISGKIGYNYSLNIPNSNKVILFGFSPYNQSEYNIADGWAIKLPYLDIANSKYVDNRGYMYKINNTSTDLCIDVPYIHSLKICKTGNYLLRKPFGVEEYFSENGRILKTVDEYGNSSTYSYEQNNLSSITYSDGTIIEFDVSKNDYLAIKYFEEDASITLAKFIYSLDDVQHKLISEINDIKNRYKFKYDTEADILLLKSYSNNERNVNFVYKNINSNSISNMIIAYKDGITEQRIYYYDDIGRISKIIDEDITEEYSYYQDSNGSFTICTSKAYNGMCTYSSETINHFYQTTEYRSGNSILQLEYNECNRISEEKENGKSIFYTYRDNGKVSEARLHNGQSFQYDYYPNGNLKSVTNTACTLLRNNFGKQLINTALKQQGITKSASGAGVTVLYNINSDVGVTNLHTVLGVSQTSFNCYTAAIGKYDMVANPGYYCGEQINLNSLSGIKLLTEKDQKSLGRRIIDSSVAATIPYHGWKIALRIKSGVDYHFMSSDGSTWEFKAGISNPCMQLLNGKTPDTVSWDLYRHNPVTGRYVVDQSAFYNSSIYYMIIRD